MPAHPRYCLPARAPIQKRIKPSAMVNRALLSGFGVMRALATLQRKPTVIVLTNFGLPEYERASLAFGATLFLDKSRDFARLPTVLIKIREEQLAAQ